MTFLMLAAATAVWPASMRGIARPVPRRRWSMRPDVLLFLSPIGGWFVCGPYGCAAAMLIAASVRVLRRCQLHERRRTDVRRELAQAVEILVGELKTGASQVDSCSAVAGESSGAVRRVFESASARCRLGGSCSDSLLAEQDWPSDDLGRIGAIWQMAEQHGLPVAHLLEAARRDIAERLRFDAAVHSSLAGPRATAAVLSALPVFGIALGEVMGANPVGVLMNGGAGGLLLVVGCGFACAGRLWTLGIMSRVRA